MSSNLSDLFLHTLTSRIHESCKELLDFDNFLSVSGFVCVDIDGKKQHRIVIDDLLKKSYDVDEKNSHCLKTLEWQGWNKKVNKTDFCKVEKQQPKQKRPPYVNTFLRKSTSGPARFYHFSHVKKAKLNTTFTRDKRLSGDASPTRTFSTSTVVLPESRKNAMSTKASPKRLRKISTQKSQEKINAPARESPTFTLCNSVCRPAFKRRKKSTTASKTVGCRCNDHVCQCRVNPKSEGHTCKNDFTISYFKSPSCQHRNRAKNDNDFAITNVKSPVHNWHLHNKSDFNFSYCNSPASRQRHDSPLGFCNGDFSDESIGSVRPKYLVPHSEQSSPTNKISDSTSLSPSNCTVRKSNAPIQRHASPKVDQVSVVINTIISALSNVASLKERPIQPDDINVTRREPSSSTLNTVSSIEADVLIGSITPSVKERQDSSPWDKQNAARKLNPRKTNDSSTSLNKKKGRVFKWMRMLKKTNKRASDVSGNCHSITSM